MSVALLPSSKRTKRTQALHPTGACLKSARKSVPGLYVCFDSILTESRFWPAERTDARSIEKSTVSSSVIETRLRAQASSAVTYETRP